MMGALAGSDGNERKARYCTPQVDSSLLYWQDGRYSLQLQQQIHQEIPQQRKMYDPKRENRRLPPTPPKKQQSKQCALSDANPRTMSISGWKCSSRDKKKRLGCTVCAKTFRFPSHLKIHMRFFIFVVLPFLRENPNSSRTLVRMSYKVLV